MPESNEAVIHSVVVGLEELEAAADTWQDRDSLPEHCRKLGQRARYLRNKLIRLTQQPHPKKEASP